jgi:haloacetate dehalogenase
MSVPEHDMLPGFADRRIDTGDVVLHVRTGGSGPPVLLLHGYPQTHAAWHLVAPVLAKQFSVVVPDLRGYGQSSCAEPRAGHRAYAKRTMALDAVRLMTALGHGAFSIVGHDRGARVAYRLALDRPDLVERLVLIDILSTYDQWQPEHHATRRRIFHWAFLAQPAPIPETLVGANPGEWVDGRFRRGTAAKSLDVIDARALACYRACLDDPDRINATCEDYRAGAGADLADDTEDRVAGRRIEPPTLVIWGSEGSLADVADPLALWQPWCRRVEGLKIEGGHYLPEENPMAVVDAVRNFLASPLEPSP